MTMDHSRDGGRRHPSEGDHLPDETLSRLVDDDLPVAERSAAEAHLSTCAACRSQLDALRSTVALLRALPMARPGRSFQLGPAHAGRPAGWRRLADRLTPALPGLRAGALALVLILGGVTAAGLLRDDSTGSDGDRAESTVAAVDGEAGPTIAAPAAAVQTSEPTSTPDAAQSRSGQPAAAEEVSTRPPAPTSRPSEEQVQLPAAAPVDATRTAVPPPTRTPETESFVGIEEEAAEAGEDAADAADAPAESDSNDDSSAADRDAAASEANFEPADESASDAAAEDSGAASSDAVAEPTPSATPSATATATPLPATPIASPVASPVARSNDSFKVATTGSARMELFGQGRR